MNYSELNLESTVQTSAQSEVVPETEPERQRYFREKAKRLVARRSAEAGRPLTCCIHTFGCQMNARDSEKLLGILEAAGYVPTEDELSLIHI